MKVRRILRLKAFGWDVSRIAADRKIRYTTARVRQILAEARKRYEAGVGREDD